MRIVNFVLGPILKLVNKYGHLCGCFIACRDMQEDPDESEEEEEQPNEEMEDQREEQETKEGEGELEEGEKGNWKKGFIKPCDLVVIDVAVRFLIEDEEDKKACGGEESDEVEENGEQAEKKHKVGIRAAWAPAKHGEKTEEEEDGGEETEEAEVGCRFCCCPYWRCPSLNPVTHLTNLLGWLISPVWNWMKNVSTLKNSTA